MTWQCFTSLKYNAIPRKIIAVESSSSPYVFKELNLYGKCRKKVSQQHLLTSVLNKGCTENVGSFFFYLGFLSRTFPIHRTAVEGGSVLFYSSLPLRTASQALKHQPSDYCRERLLQGTHLYTQQQDLNQELLVSEYKSLTAKLRALNFHCFCFRSSCPEVF